VRAEEATLSADALLEGLPEGYKFGASVELKGMTLKSVLGPSHENSYLTLDEAMASELCTVSEGSGGLNVQNHSDKPIFCMAGDLMLGGHQDRILAENIVVGPRSSVTAPVFCVEAGRSCADPRDGEAGSRGEFFKDEHRGQVDLSVKRAAIQSISQNDVWAEVARCNADLNCSCVKETGTFRNIYDDKNTAQMIERNVVSASTLGARGVVGYAAFVDGRLVALELFDSADLCAKLSAKLLRGYIITGLSGGYSTGKCFPVPAHAMVADHEESPGVGEKGDSSASAVLASAREKSVQAMETSPSTRTQIRREYRADSVRYFCTDTTTGRRVHFSLMRR
jgi:hypothetical protein